MRKYWITRWKHNGYYQVPYTVTTEAKTDEEAFRNVLGRFPENWEITCNYLIDKMFNRQIARIERIDVNDKILMVARYIG